MYKKVTKIKKIKEYSDVPLDKDYDVDYICTDIPLFLRLLEWSKETAADDAALHKVAEIAHEMCEAKEDLLSMEDYDKIVAKLAVPVA